MHIELGSLEKEEKPETTVEERKGQMNRPEK